MPYRLLSTLLLLGTLAGGSGCGFAIPLNQFLDVANGFALAPQKTCIELAEQFDLPAFEGLTSPADIGLSYLEQQIPVAEGRSLRAWFIPAADAQGLVVLSYGAVGEMTCYLWIVLNLVERGWSVVMYDFTGFGGSTGTPSLVNLAEDGRAAIDWALPFSEDGRVIVMGISLGTIPSVINAVENPDVVTAIVLDGPISLRAEVERFSFLLGFRPEDYVPLLPAEALMDLRVADITQPLLAYTYGHDEFATSAVAVDLLAGSGGPVQVRHFADLAHVRAAYFAQRAYFHTLSNFLSPYARDPGHLPQVDLGDPTDYILQVE